MALVPYIYQQETDQAFFVLLTFTNPRTNETSRFVNNNEDVTSRGNVFFAYPFQITLPTDKESETPTAQLTIDNVDRQIMDYIRATLEPPEVKIEVILSGSPDTVERTIDFLQLINVNYNSESVSGTLQLVDFMNLPAIDSIYSGLEFPDLVYQ